MRQREVENDKKERERTMRKKLKAIPFIMRMTL